MENKKWVIYATDDEEIIDDIKYTSREEAEKALLKYIDNAGSNEDWSAVEVRELKKYIVDQWIHAHFCTEVYATSFEEAESIAECGGDDASEIKFEDLDVGDCGISCIYDEEGNEYWCE